MMMMGKDEQGGGGMSKAMMILKKYKGDQGEMNSDGFMEDAKSMLGRKIQACMDEGDHAGLVDCIGEVMKMMRD